MKNFTLLIILLFFTISSTLLYAQSDEQRRWLQEFSIFQTKQYEENIALAKRIAKEQGMPERLELSDGTIIVLAGYKYGRLLYEQTDNLIAAQTVSTDELWAEGSGIFELSGDGITLGLWEAGGIPRTTHQEYSGRVEIKDGTSSGSDHATHVAGTMIGEGIDPQAKGMSFEGLIHAYSSGNDLGEVSNASLIGIRVTNHSYGYIRGWRSNARGDGRWGWYGDPAINPVEDWQFGFYSNTSKAWDNMLYNAPYILVCKSAGNDRNDGPGSTVEHWVSIGGVWQLSSDPRDPDGGIDGYDSVNDDRGIAKNTLTVGAVNDIPGGYRGPNSVVMSSFSNWGPVDDGRIKPDLVANGVNLYSSTIGSDNSYGSKSGTSMSTPNMSGSVGLLLEQQKAIYGVDNPFRSSTMKGLLIHTADEAGPHPGPDYTFGWGLLNTFRAAFLMLRDSEIGNYTLIKEDTLTEGETYTYSFTKDHIGGITVTLCWTDPGGSPTAPMLDPPNLMLVNDLDVRVTGPGGTLMPWVLDPNNPSAPATKGDNFRDNVEKITTEQYVTHDTYTVTVTHKNSLTNGSQPFSLIISGVQTDINIAAPDVVYPPDNAVDIDPLPTLEWTYVPLVDTYYVQIATDSLFTHSLLVDEIITQHTRAIPDTLPGQTQLYWRVTAMNNSGGISESGIHKFTTKMNMPDVPELVYPGPLAEDIPFDFSFQWNAAANAQQYHLLLGNSPFFNSGLIVNDSTITDTSYAVTGLEDGYRYYWKVASINTTGKSSYNLGIFSTLLPAPDSLRAANVTSSSVELAWNDMSDNESKFKIFRSESGGNYSLLAELTSDTETHTDDNLSPETEYSYKIVALNQYTASDTTGPLSVTTSATGVGSEGGIPEDYFVDNAYPNPFNPATTITFGLPSESRVTVTVYNTLGEKKAMLLNDSKPAGYHQITWNAESFSSGIYIVVFDAVNNDGKKFYDVRKLMLLK